MGMALLQFNQAELVQLDMEGMSQVRAAAFGPDISHGLCFGVDLSHRLCFGVDLANRACLGGSDLSNVQFCPFLWCSFKQRDLFRGQIRPAGWVLGLIQAMGRGLGADLTKETWFGVDLVNRMCFGARL